MTNQLTAAQIHKLSSYAEDGDRITALVDGKTKTLWKGLGNRAGLHSFAYQLTSEAWSKGQQRFLKKLAALPSGSTIMVAQHRSYPKPRWTTLLKINC